MVPLGFCYDKNLADLAVLVVKCSTNNYARWDTDSDSSITKSELALF